MIVESYSLKSTKINIHDDYIPKDKEQHKRNEEKLNTVIADISATITPKNEP